MNVPGCRGAHRERAGCAKMVDDRTLRAGYWRSPGGAPAAGRRV